MIRNFVDRIIDIEINFCSLFSDTLLKDYGKLFFCKQNRLSWDSNHAIIVDVKEDLNKIIENIENEFKKRKLIPRIYNSFRFDDEIATVLRRRKWKFEDIGNCTFYLHRKDNTLKKLGSLIKIEKYTEELGEIVLSDPDEGEWTTNSIKIGLSKNSLDIVGISHNNKLIGFYIYHNQNPSVPM